MSIPKLRGLQAERRELKATIAQAKQWASQIPILEHQLRFLDQKIENMRVELGELPYKQGQMVALKVDAGGGCLLRKGEVVPVLGYDDDDNVFVLDTHYDIPLAFPQDCLEAVDLKGV